MPDSDQQVAAGVDAAAGKPVPLASEGEHPLPALTGFGEHGAEEFKRIVSEYITALEQLSRTIARDMESDAVSPPDVRAAQAALRGLKKAKGKHANEIGTALIGFGSAYLVSVIFSKAFTFGNGLLIFIPLLVGFTLCAYSWNRD